MIDKKYPSQALDKFQLRFPEGLRDRIKDVAEIAGRSMNTEIIQRLEDSFEDIVEKDAFPTPEQARKWVLDAKKRIQSNLRRYALDTIMLSINDGQSDSILDFQETLPEIMNTEEGEAYIQPVIDELITLGYNVKKSEGSYWYEVAF